MDFASTHLKLERAVEGGVSSPESRRFRPLFGEIETFP